MKSIARIVGAVVLLVVVAAAAAPFWLGMQAENAYNTLVQQLAASSTATVTTKRYDRGWLGSTAETTVAVPGSPLAFSLTHDIAHGPIPVDRLLQGELQLTPALAFVTSQVTLVPKKGKSAEAWLKNFMKRMGSLKAETVFDFGGNANMMVDIPPTKSKAKGGEFNWRGLSGTIAFRQGGQQINTELKSPGLSIASEQRGKFSLSRVTFRSDTKPGTGGLVFGNSSLHVGGLTFGADVNVKGLRLITKSKPVGKNLRATVNYQIKDVKVGNKHYGPGQLTFVLRKLDTNALRKYEQAVNRISKGGRPEEQASMMVAAETMKLVANLSKKAPELEVTKLSFKTVEGELTGKGKIVLDGSDLDVAQNAMLLIRALRGNAELSIPPSMVKAILTPRIKQDIEIYKQRGLLTPEEVAKLTPEVMSKIVDEVYPSYLSKNSFTKLLIPAGPYYRITASFREGKFLVNDRPLGRPLPGLPM